MHSCRSCKRGVPKLHCLQRKMYEKDRREPVCYSFLRIPMKLPTYADR